MEELRPGDIDTIFSSALEPYLRVRQILEKPVTGSSGLSGRTDAAGGEIITLVAVVAFVTLSGFIAAAFLRRRGAQAILEKTARNRASGNLRKYFPDIDSARRRFVSGDGPGALYELLRGFISLLESRNLVQGVRFMSNRELRRELKKHPALLKVFTPLAAMTEEVTYGHREAGLERFESLCADFLALKNSRLREGA